MKHPYLRLLAGFKMAMALWLGLAGMSAGEAAGAELTFAVTSVSGSPGSTIMVPVRVSQFAGINSFQFSIHWNPVVAQYMSLGQFGLPGLAGGNFGTTSTNNGTLTVSWDDGTGASQTLSDGATVFAVQLKLIGTAGSATTVSISSAPTAIEAVNADLEVVPVTVTSGQVTAVQGNIPPSLTTQPQSQTVVAGNDVSFTVLAAGTSPLSYHWCLNGVELPAATNAALTLANVQPDDAGDYSVMVTNRFGAVASTAARLTVNVSTDTVPPAIIITSPTTGSTYSTTNSVLNLSGIASDNVSVMEVTHGNNRGGNGKANGTTNWVVSGLTLQPGPNVLTLVAHDAAGNTKSGSLTVVYTPPASAEVTFAIAITNGPPGAKIFVPVRVSRFTDISSAQFSLHWDPAVASFSSLGQFGVPTLSPANFGTTMTNQGTLLLSWDDSQGIARTLSDGETFFAVELQLIASIGAMSEVSIDGNPLGIEVVRDFSEILPVAVIPGQVTIEQQNTPPILGAIGNRTIGEGSTVSFTALATDAETPAQTLTFSLDAGAPAGASINAASGVFSWTPTETQGPSVNTVTVRVTDNGSPAMSDSETITITVNEVNAAPVLGNIGNRTGTEGSQISFTATATDADVPANTLMFSLDAGAPAGATINANTGAFTWTPAEAQGPSTNTVIVRVTDNGSPPLNDFEIITITVNELNTAPVLGAIGNRTVNEGSLLTFTATATDADTPGQALTYTLDAGAPAGANINSTTGVFSWTPGEAQGGSTNTVTIRVTDNGSPLLSDFETITIRVTELNAAPVLGLIGDKTVNEGSLLTFTASATDADIPTQTLTYSLDAGAPVGASINSSSGAFTWTPGETQGPSTNTVTIRVTDNGSPPQNDFETITIRVAEANIAPVLGAIGDRAVNEGSLLTFTATATDADAPAQPLTFSLDAGAPAGASINPNTGVFTWTPSEAQGPSMAIVTIRVADNGAPSLTDSETITITVNEMNVAPVLGAIGNKTVTEGGLLTFTATATDADVPANTLTFSLDAGAPAGASIDASSGVFAWTPTEAQGPGTNTITIRVTDNGATALNDFETIIVTVNEVNTAPVLAGIGDRTIGEGNPLSFTAMATDSDLPANTLTFSLDAGAPVGASINSSSGLFTWTPTAAQGPSTNTVTIRVTDNGSPALNDFETIRIVVTEVNTPPMLGAIGNRTLNEGSLLTFMATATDSDVPAQTLTFSLDAGAPAGASINAGSGVFTWTPGEAQGPSTNTVTIRVTDSGSPALNDFETITITVNELNAAPVLAVIGNRAVSEGNQLSFTAAATDADLPLNTLTYTLDAGAPAGAGINANSGVFTWTPSAAQGPSTNTVTIRVTDNGSPPMNDFETITIIVTDVNTEPVLSAIGNKTINEGALLTFTALATDGDIPVQTLTFSLDAGAPAGATINPNTGAFTWTPSEGQGPGTNIVTIRVTDNGFPPLNDFETIIITVNEVNAAPVLAVIGNRSIAEGSQLSFTATATDTDLPANTLTFSLDAGAPAGASINGSSGLFLWTPGEAQGPSTNIVTIRVADNGSPSQNDFETITIIVSEANNAPVLAAIGNASVNEGNLLTFTVSATDTDTPAQTLTYSLDSGAPAGASINPASGVFTWIPNEGQGPGTNTVTIRVTDNGSPPLNDFETITITVGEVNAAPVLPVIGNKTVVEGSLLSFTVTATDADTPGQTLVYSLDAGAPAGASVDATTGVFTWRPSETQGPAMNNVTIRVTDNGSPSLNDSETITITVTEANSEPILAFIADKIVTEGTQLSFTVIASDSDMPTNSLSFSLGVASPAGASIHPTTGLFTWVPNEEQGPGTNIIAVFVNDNGSPALSTARIFTVVVLESNSPPVLMPVSNYVAQVLVPLRVTNVVTDADVPTNRVTFELVQAPKGVRINKFTGVLTWSPAREQARTTNMITVAAMDEGNPSLSVSNTFLVVVDDYLELSLGTTVLRAGELGSVPVNLVASTTPVTNLSSSLLLASQRLVDRSLTSFAPELSSATLQSEAPNVEKMIFNTTNGQVLRQSRLLARFNFTALANQSSAFVPLVLSNIVALQTNGLAVPRTLASAGRVVVVGREPLLESLLSTNLERSLILYGEPGSGYLVESTTDPSDENSWQPVWQGTLTTLSLSIAPATLTNDITFFRAIRQVAPGQDR